MNIDTRMHKCTNSTHMCKYINTCMRGHLHAHQLLHTDMLAHMQTHTNPLFQRQTDSDTPTHRFIPIDIASFGTTVIHVK